MYSCTCLNSTLHYIICKHVHLVHINYTKGIDKVNNKVVELSNCSNEQVVPLSSDQVLQLSSNDQMLQLSSNDLDDQVLQFSSSQEQESHVCYLKMLQKRNK